MYTCAHIYIYTCICIRISLMYIYIYIHEWIFVYFSMSTCQLSYSGSIPLARIMRATSNEHQATNGPPCTQWATTTAAGGPRREQNKLGVGTNTSARKKYSTKPQLFRTKQICQILSKASKQYTKAVTDTDHHVQPPLLLRISVEHIGMTINTSINSIHINVAYCLLPLLQVQQMSSRRVLAGAWAQNSGLAGASFRQNSCGHLALAQCAACNQCAINRKSI